MALWITMTATALLVPAVMVVFGAVFLKKPPKKINGWYGYRTSRSMASQAAWDFAHRTCGKVWLRWGITLGIVAPLLMLPVLGAGEERLTLWSGSLTLLQCVALVASIFPVERALRRHFDKNGHKISEE